MTENPDLPPGPEPNEQTEEAPAPGPVRLKASYEKKGRKGKPVTIIEGFKPGTDIPALASRLKARLGVGGSADEVAILLQGDHRNDAMSLLKEWGVAK